MSIKKDQRLMVDSFFPSLTIGQKPGKNSKTKRRYSKKDNSFFRLRRKNLGKNKKVRHCKKDQRLMVDNLVLDKIVEYADPTEKDVVLEVGAGNGHLTVELAERAGMVFAVESDGGLFSVLKERVRHYKNVKPINGDALKMKLPECTKIVSNLPYSISRKITVKLLEHGFKEAFLLYQREFVQKLMAKPGQDSYRFISALVQSTCSVESLMEVPASAFQPQPRVSSMLVKLTQKARLERKYTVFLQKLFNHKNKNLKNIIENPPKEYASLKPSEMPPEEFIILFSLLNQGCSSNNCLWR